MEEQAAPQRRPGRWLAVTSAAVAVVVVAAVVLTADGEGTRVVAGDDPGTEQAAADVLDVSCETGRPNIDNPVVRTHADGVHVEVVALPADGTSVTLTPRGWSEREEGEGSGIGQAVEAGRVVMSEVPPGEALVRCYPDDGPRHMMDAEDDPESVPVTVVDEGGHWRRPGAFECRSAARHVMVADYGAPPGGELKGKPGTPMEQAALQLQLDDGDELEPAGYVQGEHQWVRVIRDGRLVTLASYQRQGDGWLLQGSGGCDGEDGG